MQSITGSIDQFVVKYVPWSQVGAGQMPSNLLTKAAATQKAALSIPKE
ncbi:MAG TPA: hypothetical protein VI756_32025 [Blastocatellia bacterium]